MPQSLARGKMLGETKVRWSYRPVRSAGGMPKKKVKNVQIRGKTDKRTLQRYCGFNLPRMRS
ncbi:MAG TPA: hypothetical protein VHU16_00970 [Candidatus Udaeobacter sp.]|jgi:hypothetical protein|nr:hypothetical protein [Candidatus Udaeobacter sp.]